MCVGTFCWVGCCENKSMGSLHPAPCCMLGALSTPCKCLGATYAARTAQVLGAKRKNLAGFSSTAAQPHQGFIFGSEIIQQTPPSLRSKAARLVGAKCTLLARIDAYGQVWTGQGVAVWGRGEGGCAKSTQRTPRWRVGGKCRTSGLCQGWPRQAGACMGTCVPPLTAPRGSPCSHSALPLALASSALPAEPRCPAWRGACPLRKVPRARRGATCGMGFFFATPC